MNENLRHDDESLAELLRRAMPAPELSDGEVDSVRQAAKAAWRETVAARESSRRQSARLLRGARWRQAWPRRMAWAGLMAAVALVAVMIWRAVPQGGAVKTPVVVARVESTQGSVELGRVELGSVELGSVELESVELESGVELTEGARVRTGSDGHIALRTLAGEAGPGVQLRLDVDSAVTLASDRRVELERGAVYVDTGRSGLEHPETAIEVLTSLGLIHDVGTRFEVRWLPEAESVRLRVRDGEVVFKPGDGTSLTTGERAAAGTVLEVRSNGEIERGVVPLRGASWDWVHRAAPPFDLEGKSLDEFLNWLRRESNLTIRIADPALVQESRSVILHGSVEGMTPGEALPLVLLGSGLQADVAELESTGEVVIKANAD